MNYIDLLKHNGDKYERQAINLLDLEKHFPRYAEFWVKFVLPYRNESNLSKLQKEVPQSIERCINNHYWILCKLLKVKKQCKAIQLQLSDVIDFEDALANLSTCIDLVRRIFILVEVESRDLILKDLEKTLRYKRIDTFQSIVTANNRQQFDKISEDISKYRNIILHSTTPLRMIDSDGSIAIPVSYEIAEKYLKWSSALVKKNDFVVSHQLIGNYLYTLISSINDLWRILIPKFEKCINLQNLSTKINYKYDASRDTQDQIIKYSGGTVEHYPTDLPPSAYNFIDPNDPL